MKTLRLNDEIYKKLKEFSDEKELSLTQSTNIILKVVLDDKNMMDKILKNHFNIKEKKTQNPPYLRYFPER